MQMMSAYCGRTMTQMVRACSRGIVGEFYLFSAARSGPRTVRPPAGAAGVRARSSRRFDSIFARIRASGEPTARDRRSSDRPCRSHNRGHAPVSAMRGRYDTFAPECGPVLTLFRLAARCPRSPIPRARKPVRADARVLERCAAAGAHSRQVHEAGSTTHARRKQRRLRRRLYAARSFVLIRCRRTSLPVRTFTQPGGAKFAFASRRPRRCQIQSAGMSPLATAPRRRWWRRRSHLARVSRSRCAARAATVARIEMTKPADGAAKI